MFVTMTTAQMTSGLKIPSGAGNRSSNSWSDQQPPTVSLNVIDDRDYAPILQQTKKVYDQLLVDKHNKLMSNMIQQKSEFDARCDQLARKGGSGGGHALEYGVRAQEALNKLQKQSDMELEALQQDYQEKLLTMQHSLEAKWRAEHAK